jgi:hypothetical protein
LQRAISLTSLLLHPVRQPRTDNANALIRHRRHTLIQETLGVVVNTEIVTFLGRRSRHWHGPHHEAWCTTFLPHTAEFRCVCIRGSRLNPGPRQSFDGLATHGSPSRHREVTCCLASTRSSRGRGRSRTWRRGWHSYSRWLISVGTFSSSCDSSGRTPPRRPPLRSFSHSWSQWHRQGVWHNAPCVPTRAHMRVCHTILKIVWEATSGVESTGRLLFLNERYRAYITRHTVDVHSVRSYV